MITDVHCHLDLLEGLEEKLTAAERAGIGRFVTSALTEESAEKSFALAERFKGKVFVTIGLDPSDAEAVGDFEKRMEFIRKNADKIVGIGEVGLDFMKASPAERELQKAAFSAAIALSKELDLPLIVHSRSAGKYALAQLVEGGAKRVIMHAFDGRPSYAIDAISRGSSSAEGRPTFFFSIPPSVVFSSQKQELVKALPMANLLLESDAPSLGPVKGEPNEPANISLALEKMREIRGTGKDTLIEQIEKNVAEAYGIRD